MLLLLHPKKLEKWRFPSHFGSFVHGVDVNLCWLDIDMTKSDNIRVIEQEMITLPPSVEGCCTGAEN